MKLVHNSDEEKKLCNSLSHIIVILCCFPWIKISVLSSQHIIQVLRLINMFLSCIYTYVYLGKYCLFLREAIIRYLVKKGMVSPSNLFS